MRFELTLIEPLKLIDMVKLIKFSFVIMLFACGTVIAGQKSDSKKADRKLKKVEAFEEMVELVKNKPIEFVAERAYPSGYRNVDLFSNPNHLRIDNDNADIAMPYFGRAYQVTPGERGGFYTESEIEDMKLEVNEKKRKVKMDFVLRNKNDLYTCSLEVFGSGSATLSIISNNRNSISYNGSVSEWIEDGKEE